MMLNGPTYGKCCVSSEVDVHNCSTSFHLTLAGLMVTVRNLRFDAQFLELFFQLEFFDDVVSLLLSLITITPIIS